MDLTSTNTISNYNRTEHIQLRERLSQIMVRLPIHIQLRERLSQIMVRLPIHI
jgi:hypothetical protein